MSDILGVNNPDDNPLLATGMTLRDFFAAHALCGMCANPKLLDDDGIFLRANFESAYVCADEMLRARSK